MTPAAGLATARGLDLSVDEAEQLLGADGEALDDLLARAGALRDAGLAAAGRAGVVTYSRKVFVPVTTLCRDRCHYCVFVDTPNQLLTQRKPLYMSPEQVLAVARQGQAQGCKEALLTLGDRPEDRWPQARAWLDAHGYASTLDYVAAMARLITAETGMLAHANPGVMSLDELRTMRPVSPSMGMMLETTSRRLYEEPGQVHHGSPDKDPAVRLQVLDDAGTAAVPFTTGILVGIGETLRDRAESLFAIRDVHARHGHIHEVIVQNFRAKPRTAAQSAPDATVREYVAAVAVARLVLGPHMRVQVPPNLSDAGQIDLLLRAGADDVGGISPLTADHVNPERPWPHLGDLAAHLETRGFTLTERLTAHPEYVRDAARWIDPALHRAVAALADPATGLARGDAPARPAPAVGSSSGADAGLAELLDRAASDPLAVDDAEWERLLTATGDDLDTLARTADDVRRYTVGEAVTLVVNRNLTSSGFRRAGARADGEFDLDDVAAIARDAAALGATELCVQGRLPSTEDPDAYLDILHAARAAAPDLHLHAYRPQDVWDLADRSGLSVAAAASALREAGAGTAPGTGVKVLSERVRALVAPDDLEIERWVDGIRAVHGAGLRTTSVLFYGHVETAAERITHLRALRGLQDETGGFTEFVPIPLPGPHGGVPLVPGRRGLDEHRAMVAVSRLMLSGSIAHVQVPWPRVGREAAVELLRSGGDDLGGVLLDGTVRPDAGIEAGQELPADVAARMAAGLFRPFRLRTTDYRVRA